jgi:N-acetylglucosamine kinase-like BadF-type ATPase
MAQKPVCRIGDQGQGICHLHASPTPYTTTFISNPGTTVTADGLVVCTIGAIGNATCGHQTIATTGSGLSQDINGNAFHRVGDQGHIIGDAAGIYTATTGSGIVSSE